MANKKGNILVGGYALENWIMTIQKQVRDGRVFDAYEECGRLLTGLKEESSTT